jgi:DNA repair exonuclease SbcCD ATPase subunit
LDSLIKEQELNKESLEIVKSVVTSIQKNIKIWLEDTLNSTLDTLYPEERFKVSIVFNSSSSKAGCDIKVCSNKEPIGLYDIGGGALDIINFLIQISLVTLQKKSRILIADEPLKHLDSSRQVIAASIINSIANKLNLQIILVTHSKEFKDQCPYIVEF